MKWKLFKKIDLALGWLVFCLATLTYLFTMSHSANLWDCAEFIVCINKLEVGHPPGSPVFMLVYNLVTQFTSDPTQVAMLCNATSAMLSGFTIFFLFLTITHLLRRFVAPGVRTGHTSDGAVATLAKSKAIAIFAAAFGGAMLYAFTDTFWFSAVEAEVYAFSSFFTALVFWLMLKWEERADSPRSDGWLVLIAYFIGLGIGVHLLNLLCLPAMALIFYFRRADKPSIKGSLLVLILSFALIVVIMFGVIQGSMKVAIALDLFTVNTLGWSFNSGMILYLVLLVGVIIWSLWEMHQKALSHRSKLAVLCTAILTGIPFMTGSIFIWFVVLAAICYLLWGFKELTIRTLYAVQMSLVALMIGFSSYGVIAVRSYAQPPMNENDPSTPINLKKYLNREQYASIPLLSGQTFASRIVNVEERPGDWMPAPKGELGERDRYVRGIAGRKYIYDHEMFFTRIHSPQPDHIYNYNIWMRRNPSDKSQPSFGENLLYFFSYQVNYMYWRYFGWNFVGRQNDLQGDGGMLKGGVATGIGAIDSHSWGKAEYYPDEMAKNKAHNVYYLMPLILGLLGIAFQLGSRARGAQSFWVVFFFFVMTGLAIVLYINQTPNQPRERDYAYAGSFYAFAIWIGFGIMALWEWLRKIKHFEIPATAVACIAAVGVPFQMFTQNLDDHNRSGRTVAADTGYNCLESCEPNAIIFCFGDNDTFPLWYMQEVEGVRQDCRTANLSYLAAEWYVDQMRTQAYTSSPVPLTLMKPEFYHHVAFVNVHEGGPLELGQALDYLSQASRDQDVPMPTKNLFLPIDSFVVGSKFPGIAPKNETMHISLANQSYLARDGLFVLDLIKSNNWKRPIYFLKSTPTNAFSNLSDYLVSSGAAWQLFPVPMKGKSYDRNLDREYALVMNKFRWFGASSPDVYYDENIRRQIIMPYRASTFPSIAIHMNARGDREKAQNVLRKCFKEILPENTPYGYSDLNLALACYEVGLVKEGDNVVKDFLSTTLRRFDWVLHLNDRLKERAIKEGELESPMRQAIDALQIVADAGRMEFFKAERDYLSSKLKELYGLNDQELFESKKPASSLKDSLGTLPENDTPNAFSSQPPSPNSQPE